MSPEHAAESANPYHVINGPTWRNTESSDYAASGTDCDQSGLLHLPNDVAESDAISLLFAVQADGFHDVDHPTLQPSLSPIHNRRFFCRRRLQNRDTYRCLHAAASDYSCAGVHAAFTNHTLVSM